MQVTFNIASQLDQREAHLVRHKMSPISGQ